LIIKRSEVVVVVTYYGHTKENLVTKEVLPKEQWQLLKSHLDEVARLAEERASKFGAGKLGQIIGLSHDIGKYSKEFQRRLEGLSGKVDHATAGAQEVNRRFGKMIGYALAFAVAGHHGGLPDGNKGAPGNLPERLGKTDIPDYKAFAAEIEIPGLNNQDLAGMPIAKDPSMVAFSFSFCIRMLYSCLVDADFLDTERFMNVEKFKHRPASVSMETLFRRLEKKLESLAAHNRQNPSVINTARQAILERCLTMAESPPGLFTLTVPTGGGKTYSSMAFGLKHAAAHDKDRVIYVIPYTSIIEQNAEVFRDALEDAALNAVVLEHHSNFEYPEGSFDDWDKHEKAHRLASENWDMPVVVTTAVQFFESLYANKGSRCRKLHNMANSVIILDEAQMMPIEYMKPCLWALAELVLNYGATVVLCTATQPAVKELIPGGLKPVESMEAPTDLQKIFKRVNVQYGDAMSDEELASAMVDTPQVLTIVNTRRHARLLFDKLLAKTQEGVYHLSARMYPAHRKEVLLEIRQALRENKPCRVVSTQLIEAGVDVDFPCVYRSAAGIDSIAQAAGRCNREGKRAEGHVTVFYPESHGMPSKGKFSLVAGLTQSTARRIDKFDNDLLSLAAIEDFFRQLIDFERNKLDAEDILKIIKDSGDDLSFPFVDIADKFHLIDSKTVSVVVPFDEKSAELMLLAEYHKFPASLSRSMQPYVVQIYQYELAALAKEGVIRQVGNFFKFITDSSFYDQRFGLKDAKEAKAPTDVLMF
jgi:CRISPR-associated helicase Cas3/CRISPR-associated endonuclease Cas3-HD